LTMVNVTKSNFLEQSNDLLEHLPTAAFVAIDEEMTGISLPGTKRPTKDDTPSQRYKTLKAVPERYGIIQFGVALFHEHPDHLKEESGGSEFLVRRYNFYLFPPSSNDVTREVTLNPSSVAFLNEHNMNFDLWTKQGIAFVTSDVANEMMESHRDKLIKKQKQEEGVKEYNPRKRKVELSRAEDINFHARAMASLREWIDAASVPSAANADNPIVGGGNDGAPVNDDAPVVAAGNAGNNDGSFLLPPCNSFLRRALYETVETEYPSLILEPGGAAAPNQIRVWRLNPEEKVRREERLKRENWEELVVNRIGFWRVFRALSNACRGITEVDSIALAQNVNSIDASKQAQTSPAKRCVPIVVHNGLMDLLFLMTHFHAHELPNGYEETKAMIHDYFPNVYDTKVLSSEHSDSSIRNDSTVLGNLYNKVVVADEELDLSKLLTIADQSEQDGKVVAIADQLHEAAYDAYMTGAVYLALCKRILNRYGTLPTSWNGPQVGSLAHLSAPLDDEKARQLFGRNKLFLMLTLYTIDLESPLSDPLSRGMSASSTYRVAGIDPSVTTRDIVRCLSNLDNETRVNFDIVWVDDTTFMVATRHTPGDGEQPRSEGQLCIGDDTKNEEDALINSGLKRHGGFIEDALRKRFQKESITTLEAHLKKEDEIKQKELCSDIHTSYMKWWPAKVASSLMSIVGWASPTKPKRTRDVDSPAEPSSKRRRV